MNPSALDLRRLDIFCKVVELKNFSKAAEAVRLSQPTISETIRLLEETVGERLLDRLGREVLPTPAGQLLYGYARQMLRIRDQAWQALQHHRGHLSGTLRIGASTIPGAYILPSRIGTFKNRYPDIQIALQITDSERTIAALLQSEIELGIIGTKPKDGRLDCRALFSDELQLAVSTNHPLAKKGRIAPDQLLKERLIMREEGSGTRTETLQFLRSHGIDLSQLQIVADIGSSEAIRQCVKAGIGVAILSNLALREDTQQGSLKGLQLGDVPPKRTFYVVRRRNRQLTPLAEAFVLALES